jgi:hypothetical protein
MLKSKKPFSARHILKIKELKAVLNSIGDRYDDWDLAIPLSKPSIGAIATCKVKG